MTALIATFATVLLADKLGGANGEIIAAVWSWGLWIYLFRRANGTLKKDLLLYLGISILAESFMVYGWQLYTYRHGHIPYYVPPCHGLFYLLALKISDTGLFKRIEFTTATMVLIAAAISAIKGTDTEAILWGSVFAVLLYKSKERRILAILFWLGTTLEIYGTSLDLWRWFPEQPWLHLESTNPPVGGGICYAFLAVLVFTLRKSPLPENREGVSKASGGRSPPPYAQP